MYASQEGDRLQLGADGHAGELEDLPGLSHQPEEAHGSWLGLTSPS